MTQIYNQPFYSKEKEFIVAYKIKDGFWFWGAYDIETVAEKRAKELNGIVARRIDGKLQLWKDYTV